MKLHLFNADNTIMGIDAIMFVDGRFNMLSISNAVRERNKRYAKNFPHQIAVSFAIYNKDGRNYGEKHNL